MGVFDAFFGCIGDGGFTLACISGRRGDGGFTVATWLCPEREKVRPARSDGGREREKVRPAHEKWPKIGGLWRAGRVFSRKHRWRGRAGRSFSRLSTRGPVAGRTFSRSASAVGAPRRPTVPSRPDVPVGISPGGRRGPGAWHEWSRPASRRSGSPAPPIRHPSRSSGTSEPSRER